MGQGKTIRGIGGIGKISKLETKKRSIEAELKQVDKTIKALKGIFK